MMVGVIIVFMVTIYWADKNSNENLELVAANSLQTEDRLNRVHDVQQNFQLQIEAWKNLLLRGHDERNYHNFLSVFYDRERETAMISAQLLAILFDDAKSKANISNFIDTHRKAGNGFREAIRAFNESDQHAHLVADKIVHGIEQVPNAFLKYAVKSIKIFREIEGHRITRNIQASKTKVLILVIFTSVISISVLLLVFNMRIGKPLALATNAADEISKENYSILLNSQRNDEVGQLINSLSLMRDSLVRSKSKLLESNEQLYLMFNNIAEGVVTITPTGTIETINPMVTTMFGYEAEEIIGENVAVLMPEPDKGKHDGYLSAFLETGVAKVIGIGREVLGKRKAGEVFPLNLSVNQFAVGGEIKFIGTLFDLTARKNIELSMKKAMFEAEISNRAKTDFLANMSHELRTPLNAIIGFSNVMGSEVFGPLGSEKYVDYVSDIQNSGQHLLNLINDVLDVSVIEAGKLELSNNEFHLYDAVEETLRLVKTRAEIGGVALENLVDGQFSKLRADKLRIKQILVNLVSNAVKFTNDGGTVAVKTERASDNSLRIIIVDTGIGMSPHDLAKAMEKFGQGNRGDLMQAGEGTGLGLPLTKGLIEAHGGTLEIESELNKVTTVTFYLPKERVFKLDHEPL
jgi:PAS domain S-box-containing protein